MKTYELKRNDLTSRIKACEEELKDLPESFKDKPYSWGVDKPCPPKGAIPEPRHCSESLIVKIPWGTKSIQVSRQEIIDFLRRGESSDQIWIKVTGAGDGSSKIRMSNLSQDEELTQTLERVELFERQTANYVSRYLRYQSQERKSRKKLFRELQKEFGDDHK